MCMLYQFMDGVHPCVCVCVCLCVRTYMLNYGVFYLPLAALKHSLLTFMALVPFLPRGFLVSPFFCTIA